MTRQRAIRVAMTALTLAVCAALCWSVLALYGEGTAQRAAMGSSTEPIFTREGVVARLRLLAPILGLWAAGAVLSAFTGNLAPSRHRADVDSARLRDLLAAYAAETPAAALRERKRRGLLRAALGVVLAACAAWALFYLCNRENFTSWDLETVMGALLWRVLPPAALAFAAALLEGWLEEKSLGREIAALRAVPRARERRIAPMPARKETRARAALRLVLMGAAAALIVLGVRNGGLRDVLVKAINICTECIGLG